MKKQPAINPYEKTAVGGGHAQDSRLIKVIPEELNVLSLNTAAELSAGLTPYNANFMSLWAEGRGTQSMEWHLAAWLKARMVIYISRPCLVRLWFIVW